MEKIIDILQKNSASGFTITELVDNSKLSRHVVLKILAYLDGAGKVSVRMAGMAKIYSFKSKSKGKQ